jgi:hypothetical protein
MTRALWLLLGVEVLLNLGAVLACFVSSPSKRVGRHSAIICAVPAAAALAFGFGLTQNFDASGSASQRAAEMASGQLTMMNALWIWVPFMVVPTIAMVLSLLIKRSGSNAS